MIVVVREKCKQDKDLVANLLVYSLALIRSQLTSLETLSTIDCRRDIFCRRRRSSRLALERVRPPASRTVSTSTTIEPLDAYLIDSDYAIRVRV